MSIYSTLTRFAAEWREARNEALTRQLIAALPSEIQKDIGWPDALPAARRRARPASRFGEI